MNGNIKDKESVSNFIKENKNNLPSLSKEDTSIHPLKSEEKLKLIHSNLGRGHSTLKFKGKNTRKTFVLFKIFRIFRAIFSLIYKKMKKTSLKTYIFIFTIFGGVFTAVSGEIGSLKYLQYSNFTSYQSNVIKVRDDYEDLQRICHTKNYLNKDNLKEFKEYRKNFFNDRKKVYESESNWATSLLFGDEVNSAQRKLSDSLSSVAGNLDSCTDVKGDEEALFRPQQTNIYNLMLRSIRRRLIPYF